MLLKMRMTILMPRRLLEKNGTIMLVMKMCGNILAMKYMKILQQETMMTLLMTEQLNGG